MIFTWSRQPWSCREQKNAPASISISSSLSQMDLAMVLFPVPAIPTIRYTWSLEVSTQFSMSSRILTLVPGIHNEALLWPWSWKASSAGFRWLRNVSYKVFDQWKLVWNSSRHLADITGDPFNSEQDFPPNMHVRLFESTKCIASRNTYLTVTECISYFHKISINFLRDFICVNYSMQSIEHLLSPVSTLLRSGLVADFLQYSMNE